MVFSIALRLLGERGAAEEVAQDVFVELHGALAGLASREHVLFWLRRVAAHRAIDCARRRRVRPEAFAEEWVDEVHDGSASLRIARAVSAGAVGTRLERMLLSLPEAMRTAVVLRYQEEMTPAEIADVLAQPVATVKSNLQRGLELLRQKAEVVLKEFVRER